MKVRMIMFKSPWCAPCKVMTPGVEKLIADGYDIEVVDISEDPDTAQEHGVRSVPTVVIKDDLENIVETAVGFRTEHQLIGMLER